MRNFRRLWEVKRGLPQIFSVASCYTSCLKVAHHALRNSSDNAGFIGHRPSAIGLIRRDQKNRPFAMPEFAASELPPNRNIRESSANIRATARRIRRDFSIIRRACLRNPGGLPCNSAGIPEAPARMPAQSTPIPRPSRRNPGQTPWNLRASCGNAQPSRWNLRQPCRNLGQSPQNPGQSARNLADSAGISEILSVSAHFPTDAPFRHPMVPENQNNKQKPTPKSKQNTPL